MSVKRIVVVTSCTGQKKYSPDRRLTKSDFEKSHVEEREEELASHLLPAEEMYTGEQHLRLMKGIESVRGDSGYVVDLWILSAGYGLIRGDKKIAPYECTFSEMSMPEVRRWSKSLGVPRKFRSVIGRNFDIGLVLLGNLYLEACDLNDGLELGGATIFYCSASAADQIDEIEYGRPVTLGNEEAKRFSVGLVGLKGELAGRLLGQISNLEQITINELADLTNDAYRS